MFGRENFVRAGQLALFVLLLAIGAEAQQPAAPPARVPHKLTLAEAESLLLARNLTVTAARFQIEAGRAARLIAASKPNPVLSVGMQQISLSSTHFLTTNNGNAAAQPTYTVHLDKVIERGGKRELRTEQAEAQLKVAEAQLLDALRTQTFQLRQAFAQALLARENLQLAAATEQQYAQTESLTEIKVENGDLPGVELYRARAGRLQYQQQVLQARTAYEQATRDILNLLGAQPEDVEPLPQVAQAAPPGSAQLAKVSQPIHAPAVAFGGESLGNSLLDVSGTFDDLPVAQTVEELRRLALSERPDVIAARHTLAAAGQAILLARAQRKRDLVVGTEYTRVGSDHAVGATLQIPLLIYNNQRAAIAQAEAQQQAAQALLKQAEMQAATDVEKAYQAYLAARRTLNLYSSQNLMQIEKLRQIAGYSYREGATSLFEVLDAQRTYNQAISAYNQARTDYQLSLWQLEQAIGRPLR